VIAIHFSMSVKWLQVKGVYHIATEHHLPYEITQFHLPPSTLIFNPIQAGRYGT